MIIEKKSIKVKDIAIPMNHLLVKMDESYNTYQMKGRETDITASHFVYDKDKQIRIDEKLVNPFGTVIKTPMKMVFNGRKIKELTDKYEPIKQLNTRDANGEYQKVITNYSVLTEIRILKEGSLSYDTQLEVAVGERVHVSYLHFLAAEEKGLFIDTEEGRMVLIKYDHLRMVVDENSQPKRMLNGFILIQPKEYDIEVKEDDGVQFTELESGLVLLNPEKTKRTRKNQLGSVVLSGTPLKGYLEEPNKVDRETHYKKGDRILYDPRYAVKLENDLHQVISEKDLYLIRRDGIITDENEVADFDKITV